MLVGCGMNTGANMSKTIVLTNKYYYVWDYIKYGAPKCIVKGCNEHQVMRTRGGKPELYTKTGQPKFRKYCANCNSEDYKRSYKKDYCENKDGRLGWKCKHIPIPKWVPMKFGISNFFNEYDVDHIDSNRNNNHSSNFHTLCKSCHNLKTRLEADGYSFGVINGKAVQVAQPVWLSPILEKKIKRYL
tara:strand:- start:91 stop:651 length:561 start_codon:yes stop_codon:yes gene_type:complete